MRNKMNGLKLKKFAGKTAPTFAVSASSETSWSNNSLRQNHKSKSCSDVDNLIWRWRWSLICFRILFFQNWLYHPIMLIEPHLSAIVNFENLYLHILFQPDNPWDISPNYDKNLFSRHAYMKNWTIEISF